MIKPPASLTFDFDETMCLYEHYDLLDRYRGTKHQYIRRDLVEAIIECALGYYAADKNYTNEEIIDKIISEEESKQ